METESPKKKRGCLFWGLVVVGAFFALAVIGAVISPPDEQGDGGVGVQSTADDAATAVPESEPVNEPTMSAAEFAALETGMSYEDATAIIGSPGELISENEIAGTRTQMYQWDGEGSFGANANAMFQNGELIQKSQFGLE